MQQTTNKKRTPETQRMAGAGFAKLCHLMDTTDFSRHPYRGIMARVMKRAGYGSRNGIYLAIKKFRNPEAMAMVAEEIRRVNRKIEKSASVIREMGPVA
jgi:hypothetical protein